MSELEQEGAVPAAVRLVRDFVNTVEPQTGEESLETPDQLGDWLVQRGVLTTPASLGAEDLDAARTAREGLRQVLMDHAGHSSDPDAVAALNDLLTEVPVRLAFTGGSYHLSAVVQTPLHQALAMLADAIRQSAEDQTWPRLKVCARDSCRWAFYDASRNSARRWCSMAGCGNHVKMQRAYAVRKARARPR
jgi:predicted RNA-binding Zn ribbon-like protein